MPQQFITCPFSKGRCIQCAVYRGRHAEICFAAGYHGGEFKDMMNGKKRIPRGCADVKSEFPDLTDTSPTWLKDVENCTTETTP